MQHFNYGDRVYAPTTMLGKAVKNHATVMGMAGDMVIIRFDGSDREIAMHAERLLRQPQWALLKV